MKRRLFFLCAALSPIVLDSVATLANADPGYWQTHIYTDELNPIGSFFLNMGPFAYIGFVAVYFLVAAALVLKLPVKWAFGVGLLYWLGHMIGFMSQGPYWVWTLLHSDFNVVIYIFAIYSVISVTLLAKGSLLLFGRKVKLVKDK